MPTSQCLKNIQSEPAPYNRACSDNFCIKTSFARGKHCSAKGMPMDTPVLSWDPSITPIGADDYACYCCCSCYALNTPIEATKGEFVLIQNIQAGDSILTTGLDLTWKPGVVKDRSGDIYTSMVPGLYLVRYLMPDEDRPRDILVTPDHLFLMHTSKTLKKVQHLIPGNRLMTADGRAAAVMFVAHGEYETSIQSINMEDRFDGKNLTGHLINANGIVSTDYSVQCYYETGNLDKDLMFGFSNSEEVYEVGTKEYINKFESPQLAGFLSSPEEWPKGFNPKRKALIDIPVVATGFVTTEQADDIREASEFNDYSNGVPREAINKLFRIFSTDYNEVNFILDWNNEDVNAYAWTQDGQKYLVLTGGLARVKGLYVNAFSLIISAMLIRLSGKQYVAEADYVSLNVLRDIFPDSIYAELAPKGIRQVTEALFDKISEEHAAGNPSDVGGNPAVSCRKVAFWNGLSFLDIPKCGVPVPLYFHLKKAYADYDLTTVNVIFDNDVDVDSAEVLVNYRIAGVEITAAQVNEAKPGTVILSVEGLEPASKYILSVENVTSVDHQSLPEETHTVIVTAL